MKGPKARLIIEYGATCQVVELDDEKSYVLGRDEGCEIVIEEKSVSRRHLKIHAPQGHWLFEDFRSNNGIVMDGKMLRELRPEHGQIFNLGRVTCTFAEAGKLLDSQGLPEVKSLWDSRETSQPETEGEPPALEPPAEKAAAPPQPIIRCPVCGSRVQIIDFANVQHLICHACQAHLGRLAERYLEESGISVASKLKTEVSEENSLTIGEYLILRELGAGGMGKVFLGVEQATNQKVAVKVLYSSMGEERAFTEAFENEARALARIHHRNIVKIFRFGVHGKNHYIAMEYVEGSNVRQIISERRRVPYADALEIMRQSLVGLDHIHKAGIIHNDIKPTNILTTKNNEVKLVDFGIVQFGMPKGGKKREFVAGTVGYLSPEIIQGAPASPQSDIYALGVSIYYAITGHRPLRGESNEETLRLHLEKEPESPKRYCELPHAIASVLARLLSKDLNKRYQTATQVLDDLDAIELGRSLPRETTIAGRPWK